MRYHQNMDRPNREQSVTLGMPEFGAPPEWTKQAHCLDHPEWGPDTWHEKGYETLAAAVCNGSELEGRPCRVRQDCLVFALENGFKTGVWGGLHGKPLGNLVDAMAKAKKADAELERMEAETRCGRGHLLTMDNLTPKGKCLTCTKDDAVFWRRRNELVRQGELPPEDRPRRRMPRFAYGAGGIGASSA